MVIDGWSNINQEPILAGSLIYNFKPYFLRAITAGANHKTAEYCAQIAQELISDAKEEYNFNVLAVVTDNAYVMNGMRELLQIVRPGIIAYGCSAHLVNLLGHDLCCEEVVANVKVVQKYFKAHQVLSNFFRCKKVSILFV